MNQAEERRETGLIDAERPLRAAEMIERNGHGGRRDLIFERLDYRQTRIDFDMPLLAVLDSFDGGFYSLPGELRIDLASGLEIDSDSANAAAMHFVESASVTLSPRETMPRASGASCLTASIVQALSVPYTVGWTITTR